MFDDLDYVFRNMSKDPVGDDVKIAFSRVLSHCDLYADAYQKQAVAKFESFGKIVLMRNRPVKPFFHRKFAQSAMALSEAFETRAA
jgi:hypothetical protein